MESDTKKLQWDFKMELMSIRDSIVNNWGKIPVKFLGLGPLLRSAVDTPTESVDRRERIRKILISYKMIRESKSLFSLWRVLGYEWKTTDIFSNFIKGNGKGGIVLFEDREEISYRLSALIRLGN